MLIFKSNIEEVEPMEPKMYSRDRTEIEQLRVEVRELKQKLDKIELDNSTLERELRARIGYVELTLHVPLDHQTIAQFK